MTHSWSCHMHSLNHCQLRLQALEKVEALVDAADESYSAQKALVDSHYLQAFLLVKLTPLEVCAGSLHLCS